MSARKAEIERQLASCEDEPMDLGAVPETLKGFNKLVWAAPSEELKMLLQLVITEIGVAKERQIDKMQLRCDESIQPHLEEETLSATIGTEGGYPPL